MKILFIVQNYPPIRSANGICDEKILNALSQSGQYDLFCGCYKYNDQTKSERDNGINIYRMNRGFFWEKLTSAKKKPQSVISKLIFFLDRIITRIKEFVFIPIYPIYQPLLGEKMYKFALKLHQKHKFDIVIAEHNGLDTLYAGYKLKEKYPEIKFMPILWDPFTGKEPAKYLPEKFARKRLEKSEARFLGNADKIIAMQSSKSYHEQFSTQKPYFHKFVFLDIPGIIKPQKISGEPQFILKGKINIVFSGLLSLPERNPQYILELLNKTKFAEKMNCIFLCTGDGEKIARNYQEKFAGNLIVHPFVSQFELKKIFQYTDFFINIGGSNQYMVPSKIFAYLSYGKPIISTCYIDNESSQSYLKYYPLSLCIDERESIENNVFRTNEFIKQALNKKIPFEDVEKIYPNNTPEKYLDMIDSL